MIRAVSFPEPDPNLSGMSGSNGLYSPKSSTSLSAFVARYALEVSGGLKGGGIHTSAVFRDTYPHHHHESHFYPAPRHMRYPPSDLALWQLQGVHLPRCQGEDPPLSPHPHHLRPRPVLAPAGSPSGARVCWRYKQHLVGVTCDYEVTMATGCRDLVAESGGPIYGFALPLRTPATGVYSQRPLPPGTDDRCHGAYKNLTHHPKPDGSSPLHCPDRTTSSRPLCLWWWRA